MLNPGNIKEIMELLKDFLRKQETTLDRYDLLGKKVWLTIGKPEPQAGEFAKYLKDAAESFAKTDGWRILYKTK